MSHQTDSLRILQKHYRKRQGSHFNDSEAKALIMLMKLSDYNYWSEIFYKNMQSDPNSRKLDTKYDGKNPLEILGKEAKALVIVGIINNFQLDKN